MSDAAPSLPAGDHRGTAPGGVLPDAPSGPLPSGSSAEDVPPPVVQGLRVGRLLGRGGSSAVWLVTDDGGQRFALKVAGPCRAGEGASDRTVGGPPAGRGRRAAQTLTGSSASEPPAVASAAEQLQTAGRERPDPGVGEEDMVRELRLLQRFAHEHLVRVHRMVRTDQGPGMLMDLAPGGSLLGLVSSRGPLPIPEVVTVLVPIAQVLSHLHGAGALHGDVTPGNILFTAEGKPLLGDFGTARLLGSGRGATAGTPGFLDPTQRGPFDSGADVFALAAVSWFALTGRVPGPTEQRPPLVLIVPEVPQQLMQLIEDGLSSTRDRRPTADHFARILLSSAAPDPVNLVPAVHSSVLPELVTRRAGPRPAVPGSGWRRILGGRGSTTKERSGGARRPPPRGHTVPSRGTSVGAPARRRTGRPGERARNGLALAAALATVVLLIAGIAVTLGGFGAPYAVPPGPGSIAESGSSAGLGPVPSPGSSAGSGPVPGPGSRAASGPSAGQGITGREGADFGSEGQEGAGGSGGAGVPSEPPAEALLAGDPVTALRGLADLRAAAFRTADTAVLTSVDVEGSPALSADRKAVTALADSGRSLQDLSIDIRNPVVLGEADLVAAPAVGSLPGVTGAPVGTLVSLIRATAALSSYTERAASTPPADAEPSPLMAAGQQELIFILWKSGSAWRIHSVVSPPD
ncbi:protein kinase domain-containing protein [Arthrobacter burdickii]|uniref:non-specific serine/threonine protein kinase n=1 Tax=Arthrobacter burdickii TaxID=3035920 RepID=A0ABT8K3K1_9MICC|nr:serine/threonine-protein kinase [Arthrobacter burdickii]MDN4612024.1 protein kinase [Arthrobacter burdickii]